ncbi:tail fiber assembly protein [Xenorhabdus sp. PB30.3]|uniref:tail fiber assembly protein n=1 Tax=Xenorhabdus sp. PB30.3 TaxID=2788941 RepID=UPI001E64132C|nr:tail fiber assembly protein [Xenorhabdus sp. PB30.3]MCC8380181.1 tail fiber assembly protein [Xenorhabdus sp. PB30.3]
MYTYSAKDNVFCLNELKFRYIEAGTWPDDGIEVSQAIFNEFAGNEPPTGKMRIAGSDGLPAWGDIPPPTPEVLRRWAEQEKWQLLRAANEKIDIGQDAVNLNIATTAEKAALNAWRRYRVLLNRVDCSAAPDIDWPEQPE